MIMQETIDFINSKTSDFRPEIGVVLGSGLGELADEFCDLSIKYEDIPNFPVSTIPGHRGRLVFAEICGKKVVMMQGRVHYYEGYTMERTAFPIKVFKLLGVKTLIITNASGSLNKEFKPSDLMIVTDHINLMGTNPLIGDNDNTLGERFPDMSQIYDLRLQEIAHDCAKKLNIDLKSGIYIATTGPSYETPAESRLCRMLGADAVGMSTVAEAIVGNYCGIKIMGISCLTNYAAGIIDKRLNHNEVIEIANLAKNKFKSLIIEIIKNI